MAGLPDDALRITNPLVAEESVLRTSLRPGLLRAIAYNESHRRTGVALFEIGHVYPPGEGELPAEYEALTVVLAGADAPAAVAVWQRTVGKALAAPVDGDDRIAALDQAHAARRTRIALDRMLGKVNP